MERRKISSSAIVAGRQIGVGLVLVTFVTLVTFMFSFLGTILCAVMVGMMTGFGKRWKWQFLLISLVFPAALMLSVHGATGGSELSASAGWRLAGICLGTFWATYLATRGVFLLEGGDHREGSAAPAEARQQARQEAPTPWHDLDIEELQGAWSQEIAPSTGRAERRVIRVDHHELTMSLVGPDGEMQLVAKGELQVLKPAHS